MRLLILGFGYSANAVVHRLAGRCSWIGGSTRSAEKAAAMAARGIDPFLYDGSTGSPALAEAIRSASHILVTIAPTVERDQVDLGRADPVLAAFEDDLLAPRPDGSPPSIAYLSTIGVYGDAGGRWVDEFDACEPNSPRAVARRMAEESWLNLWRRLGPTAGPAGSTAVLRLSGIYGPGRNTFINLAAGTARRLVKPGQVFNRIHVEDIAQAVELCFARSASGIFNVTDDEPAPPQDVVAYAAGLMGIEPPPEQGFATADLSPMARSFYGANKRVLNARSKDVLGMRYEFPNYRVALTRMWNEDTWRAAPGQPA